MRDEEPMWRPVGDVTMLTGVTVRSVEFAREHLDTIREAGSYRVDDATVARMLRMWHDTSDLNQVFAEQGQRWRQEAPGTRHEGDVVHFCAGGSHGDKWPQFVAHLDHAGMAAAKLSYIGRAGRLA